ncbi:MAG: transketolase family protein [Desulfobacterales bacterium]|jgi:transketolase
MSQEIAQRDAFGKALVDLAQNDSRIIALDGDLATSTKTDMFAQVFPERFLQMGIAEQNMFGVAAGLATLGFIPFATTFACFTAKRALDQIRVAIAQPKLNVKMVGAYSGILTGKTGKTHQTIEDMAVFRAMPYVTTIAPVDGLEVRLAMKAIVEYEGPVYLRLTRDPCPVVMPENYEFKIGQAVVLREGGDVTLIGTGQKTIDCLEAADQLKTRGIGATVLHVPTLKPLDEKAIIQAASKTGRVVTVEEHSIIGGLGGAVAEVLVENCPLPMKRVGCRDTFAESGANEDLLEKYGLTPRHVIQTVHEVLEFGK